MREYYNEIDPYCCQWLQNLGGENHIGGGFIDARSVKDIGNFNFSDFQRCHFFAGIGVWSYAFRLAGWPENWPVWSGSCPCQPFSGAGKGEGFADERHLWPDWFKLIDRERPFVVFGEQVASPNGLAWLDIVQSEMEAAGYTFGALVAPSAGFGAPHGRHRIYFAGIATGKLVHAASARRNRALEGSESQARDETWVRVSGEASGLGKLVHAERARLEGHGRDGNHRARWSITIGSTTASGDAGGLADTERFGSEMAIQHAGSVGPKEGIRQTDESRGDGAPGERTSPVNGFWRSADWLFCRDGKWRPVEPGTFPLADGVANRVGKLRAYGNAINVAQAVEFIKAVKEEICEHHRHAE